MSACPEPRPLSPKALLAWALGAALCVPILLPFDHALVRALNPSREGPWDGVLLFLDRMMPVIMLAAAVVGGGGLWVLASRPLFRRGGLILALSPLVASRLTSVLKELLARPRPQSPLQGPLDLRVLVSQVDAESFPSGHVTTAAALALAALAVLPGMRGRYLVLLLIPLMMWDRVALGVHFPADTAGGVSVAAFTVLALSFLLRGRDPVLPASLRVPGAAVGILILSSVWPTAAGAVDPVSLEPVAGLSLKPRTSRVLLEPIVGPVLEVAYASDPMAFVRDVAPWLALGVLLLAFLPRRTRRAVRWRRASLALLLCLLWGGLALDGRLPADRFVVAGGAGVVLDPHVHGSDPVDGARDLEFMVGRSRARGVQVMAITNHDAPPPRPDLLPGVEWSGFRHPDQVTLHLVVLGGEGAISAVLELEVPPLVAGGQEGRALALQAVRRAKECGGVVVAAHYWRTLRTMEKEGTAGHLPSPQELVEAGVDGFEVANRHWDADPQDREIVAEIDRLCRQHGLLRLATSDDHGRPAGSPCITLVPGSFPDDPAARQDAVLERLAQHGEVLPAVFLRGRRPTAVSAWMAGPVAAWRYLAAIGLGSRVSLLAWFLLGWLACGRPGPDRSPR